MRLCPVLTKDNKGRKGLAWRRRSSLPALSSFTGPDPLPCPACQAPLVPVPGQGEPGPCGWGAFSPPLMFTLPSWWWCHFLPQGLPCWASLPTPLPSPLVFTLVS